MRDFIIASAVAGLLAGSSHGLINVKLTMDSVVLSPGQSTTVRVWAQGTQAGLFAFAGSVVSSGTGTLTAVPGSSHWDSAFSPTFGLTANPGTPGTNGGWSNFGSQQLQYLTPDVTFASTSFMDLFDYTVTAGTGGGYICLAFVPGNVGGYKPAECNKSTAIGTITGVCTPEPVTMSLLALGSLLLARRRRG